MRRARSRRRGVTLVEMLVYVGLLAIILDTFSMMMYSLYAGNDRVKEVLRSDAELRRLSNQLTDDAHECRSAMIVSAEEKKPAKLTLQLDPAHKIEYESKAGQLARLYFENDKMAAQDSFHLPPGCEVSWKIEDNILVVDIAPAADEIPSVSSKSHIEARLNLRESQPMEPTP